MKDEIPLERGLTYFYENEEEFSRKGYPVEKQVAIAFEAGFCLGCCELKANVAQVFKPDGRGCT